MRSSLVANKRALGQHYKGGLFLFRRGKPKCVRGVCEGCKARSIHCTVGDKGAGGGGIVNEGWELGV